MSEERRDSKWTQRWALPASVVVHSLVIALLVFGLPLPLPHPQKEDAVSVELVPPPKPPEKPKTPPQPPAEKPAPEKVDRPKTKPQPPAENAQRSPIPTLRPVFQFGDKDAGPRKSLDGDSPEDAAKASKTHDDPDKKASAEAQILTATRGGEADMRSAASEESSRTAKPGKTQDKVKLQEAKKLYSRSATDDPRAMTAMRNMPRDERGGWLCVTELREQLLNASPPYLPDLLPAYRLTDGSVMDIRKAAFRTGGRWYDLSYRCEVNKEATRVESFALHVGEPIPRSDWVRRELPSQ